MNSQERGLIHQSYVNRQKSLTSKQKSTVLVFNTLGSDIKDSLNKLFINVINNTPLHSRIKHKVELKNMCLNFVYERCSSNGIDELSSTVGNFKRCMFDLKGVKI